MTASHRSGRTTATLGVGVVAVTAAVISFNHVQDLARAAGEPELTAWLLPLSIDGAVAAAAAVVLADSRARRRPTMLTWLMLGLGLTASLAANIASAEPTWTARCVAAWPPIALALGIEVLASMSRRAREDATDTTGPAGAAAPTGPRRPPSHPAGRSGKTVHPDQISRTVLPDAPAQTTAQRDNLHLVGSAPRRAERAGQTRATGQGRRTPATTGPQIAAADAEAVRLIQELDAQSDTGPVPRRVIQAHLGCGASRAARLASLARAGDPAPATDLPEGDARPA